MFVTEPVFKIYVGIVDLSAIRCNHVWQTACAGMAGTLFLTGVAPTRADLFLIIFDSSRTICRNLFDVPRCTRPFQYRSSGDSDMGQTLHRRR